tara:strand:+ start:254 stop:808 length:555 start_codon:yes stop_codon:yes gene_type:complete
METRTAALVFDNFLSSDKWNYIVENVSIDKYMKPSGFSEWKDDLHTKILGWLKEKFDEFDWTEPHWEESLSHWSFINSVAPNINQEMGTEMQMHQEFGGFVYYVHPSWNTEWGGQLKFQNCDVDQIEPLSNRFVWINPCVLHGIQVVNDSASHNRITVVGWPEGCKEHTNPTLQINIPITNSAS